MVQKDLTVYRKVAGRNVPREPIRYTQGRELCRTAPPCLPALPTGRQAVSR
jgi:hypothetical protein